MDRPETIKMLLILRSVPVEVQPLVRASSCAWSRAPEENPQPAIPCFPENFKKGLVGPLLRSVVGSSHGQNVYPRELSSTDPRKPRQQWSAKLHKQPLVLGARSKPFPQTRCFPQRTDDAKPLTPSGSKVERRPKACMCFRVLFKSRFFVKISAGLSVPLTENTLIAPA